MEKHYIAPSLTVVAIHVERGYAESIISANSVNNDKTFFESLSKTKGCTGATEDRTVSTHWGSNEDNTFWTGEF